MAESIESPLSLSVKEVLVVYKDRRRPVKFRSAENAEVECKNVLDAVTMEFRDILPIDCVDSLFIQTKTEEWGLVDVTSNIKNHTTVYLQQGTTKEVNYISNSNVIIGLLQ